MDNTKQIELIKEIMTYLDFNRFKGYEDYAFDGSVMQMLIDKLKELENG